MFHEYLYFCYFGDFYLDGWSCPNHEGGPQTFSNHAELISEKYDHALQYRNNLFIFS